MLKNISKVMIGSAGLLAVAAVAAPHFIATKEASADTTTFQVNVKESLSVSVNTPSAGNWASGNAGDFLRNKVTVNVASNNASGFKASMYSDSTTDLTNTSDSSSTLPTLTSDATKSAFPSNYWGYSINDTDAGNASSQYSAMSTSAIPIITASAGTYSGSQNIFFGAKSDLTQASGTYTGTVVISVVTGTINENSGTDSNPTTPTDPATPNPAIGEATYSGDGTTGVGISTTTGALPSTGASLYSGTTTYTSIATSDGTTTTTTQVSGGDNTSSYSAPQGVTDRTTSNISDGSALTTALATTATVAAASGVFFFILAKRRDDDDDEEEES